MPGYERHLRYGSVAHVVLVVGTTLAYLVGLWDLGVVALTAAVFPVTLVGALFPDLDHPSSIPYRCGKRYLPVFIAVLVTVIGLRYRHPIAVALVDTNARGAGAFVSGFFVASAAWGSWEGIRTLFPLLRPPHRTITHRLSTGIVAAMCVATAVCLLVGGDGTLTEGEFVLIAVCSLGFFLGVVSHLAADGLLSDRGFSIVARIQTKED
ncbi:MULTISPECIES: metal-dependent hydrolase [unclassified Haloferax]|uniref:metal-dependent hydrolase n=1 Tax=unclassified Haloferax TaxID=2625095 RepID=UPI0009E2B28B|nr:MULTISPECIES: metal-dependent hydrolase [unclassified Haloferax]